MDQKKISKLKRMGQRILTMTLAVLMVTGTMVPFSMLTAPEVNAASETVSYTGSRVYGAWTFKVTSGSKKGMKGACMDAFHSAPPNGKAKLTQLPQNHKLTRVAYYYLIKKSWLDDWSKYAIKFHYLMSYARVKAKYELPKYKNYKMSVGTFHDVVVGNGQISQSTYDEIVTLYDKAISKVSVAPDNFEAYRLDPGLSNKQDGFTWDYSDPGKLTATKVGTDKAIATLSGYNNYSGISYDVYKSDKTTKVGTLTFKANGTSNTLSLTKGTYYAKEATTNDYYKLDTSWHTITIKENKTTTEKFKDTPNTAPLTIVKKDIGSVPVRRN